MTCKRCSLPRFSLDTESCQCPEGFLVGEPRSKRHGGPGRIDTRGRVHGGADRPGRIDNRRRRSRRHSDPIGLRKPRGPMTPRLVVILWAHHGFSTLYGATSDGEEIEWSGIRQMERVLRDLKNRNAAVYSALPLRTAISAGGDAREWDMLYYNGRRSHAEHRSTGTKVISLERYLKGISEHFGETELAEAFEFFSVLQEDYGVSAGSMVTMAENFWLRTLAEPVYLFGLRGNQTPIHKATHGGRKQARAGRFWNQVYADIPAAYPNALVADPWPEYLYHGNHGERGNPVFTYATVEVPSMPSPPLPLRVNETMISYGWGTRTGWWTYRELRMATDANIKVTPHSHIFGRGWVRPFDNWITEAKAIRGMGGVAGALAKGMTSMLWAAFSLGKADRERRHPADKHATSSDIVSESRSKLPGMYLGYIAADAHARVRERLWRECLSQTDAKYVDTDGTIIPAGTRGPYLAGWVVKNRMRTVEIAAPQVYRWQNADEPEIWRYLPGRITGKDQREVDAAFSAEWEHRGGEWLPLVDDGADFICRPGNVDVLAQELKTINRQRLERRNRATETT